jgi:hypothetical protein
MSEGPLTLVQSVVDAATLGLDVRKTQLDPGLHLIAGVSFECLQEQGAGSAISTSLALHESAAMKLRGRQHPIMMT